jgi:hypothetical protein
VHILLAGVVVVAGASVMLRLMRIVRFVHGRVLMGAC